MNFQSHLSTDCVFDLFSENTGHTPVNLSKLPAPKLLWVNREAMAKSSQYISLGADQRKYDQHLLDSCAYVIEKTEGLPVAALGYADRYGGAGIGHNGGSGRAVFANGYHIKGVGRTPLVSHLTPDSHASGGAYFEECVRETIFSEIVGAEFPCGGVPTLAIIDTGIIQTWGAGIKPTRERRTLLIRPAFLRPAHFERANGFFSGNPKEGVRDTERVEKMFSAVRDRIGIDWIRKMYIELWPKWGQQLAYSFIHRLPPGSNTTSNIALDGRLVDFGAMSAVPSWATTATMHYPQNFRMLFGALESAIASVCYSFGRHCDASLATASAIKESLKVAENEYRRTLVIEALRLCGVDKPTSREVIRADSKSSSFVLLRRLIFHYQRECIDIRSHTPSPRLSLDISSVWDECPPAHLKELSAMLKEIVPSRDRDAARQRCIAFASSRDALYFPEAKRSIFRALERGPEGEQDCDIDTVSSLIHQFTQAGRRDFHKTTSAK